MLNPHCLLCLVIYLFWLLIQICKNIKGILALTKLLVSHSPGWEQEHTGGLRILWQKSKVERVLKYQTIISLDSKWTCYKQYRHFWDKTLPRDAVFAQGSIIRCGKRGTTGRIWGFFCWSFVIFLALIWLKPQGEDGKGLRSPSNSNTAWFCLLIKAIAIFSK